MAARAGATHDVAMPLPPSFFALGAVAGLALWLADAPTPFPFLGLAALACGALGFVLSTAYIASFEPWRWRMHVASLRRTRRRVARAFAALAGGFEPTARDTPVKALRAKS
jgi:hypothetical protein